VPSLRRNRDFVLLETGQLLSAAGSQSTAVAYPLLVLALTGSPAKAGVVTAARMLPVALFSLPAGVVADRRPRRRVMIAADAVRAVALAALAATILSSNVEFWLIPVVAFVEGAGTTFFNPAAVAALQAVVPAPALESAANVQAARTAGVGVAGPPLGGALFGLHRAAPFLADAASYLASIASLLVMRTPFEESRAAEAPLREGVRFLWRDPFLRTCAFLYGLTNFVGPAALLAVVVTGTAHGLSSAAVGVLLAAFSATMLAGALVSPAVRRALSTRQVLLLELWSWPCCAVFLVWPDPYVLTAALLPAAAAIPSTDAVVRGLSLRRIPRHLTGRVESVRSAIALGAAPLGPLVAGVLLEVSARAAVAAIAAVALVLALWGTFTRHLHV